jgi:hydroxymethylbilane synthase
VLAAAGLKRLGLQERIRTEFATTDMLPAAGQGALGIEIRSDRQDLMDALAPLAHQDTWLTVTAERAVSRAMGGSCSMPLAAHGRLVQGTLHLDAAWGDPDARVPLVRASASAPVATLESADALGIAIAAQLRAGGARGVDPVAG